MTSPSCPLWSPGETGHDGGGRGGAQAEISPSLGCKTTYSLTFCGALTPPCPLFLFGLHQVWHSGFPHSLSLFFFSMFGLAVRQGTEEHFQKQVSSGEDLLISSDILTP